MSDLTSGPGRKAGRPLPALRSELSASALLGQVESDFRVFFPIRLYFVEVVASTLGAFQMVTRLGLLIADNNPVAKARRRIFSMGSARVGRDTISSQNDFRVAISLRLPSECCKARSVD